MIMISTAQTIRGVFDVNEACTNQAEFPMMAKTIINMEMSRVFFVVKAL